MKKLDDENLISGIIDAVENDEPEAVATESVEGSLAESEVSAEPAEATVPAETDEAHETIVATLVDKTLKRLGDKIREAEERGFRKAVEMARRNPAELGISRSVPNFLADVRRDVWDS